MLATKGTPPTRDARIGPAKPAYLIESVDSALNLLRAFREVGSIRVSEAALRLNVAPSTAHRLLAMLEYHGFVERNARTHEYFAGEELVCIGAASATNLGLREQAKPVMERLAWAVNETVGLGILRGPKMLYLDGVESRRTLRIASRTGALLPCHVVSMGKVLLSELQPTEFKALYPLAALERLTDRTLRSRTALVKQLATVRADGYASSFGESEDGIASVAVGIFNSRRTLRAAMSVAAPAERATQKNIAEWLTLLRGAATELGARIV